MTNASRALLGAVALAAPLVATTIGASTVSATTPSAAPPAATVTLIDDTGALTMDVPAAWTDVDTTPGTNDDGSTMPWISASTDYAAYQATFDVPGAVFVGLTHTTDLQSWIDRIDLSDACASVATEPYDDGAFVGLHATYGQCGASAQATFHTVVANVGNDTTRTYLVQVQAATAADEALVASVLGSFNAVGITQSASAVTTTTVPAATLPTAATSASQITLPDGTPLVPATAPPPRVGTGSDEASEDAGDVAADTVFTPANSLVDGAVQVTDDSRTITMAVTPVWTQTATAAADDVSGRALPQIIATSGDVAVFSAADGVPTDFAVPGVRFVARVFDADTETLVSGLAAGWPCTAGDPRQYIDPVFTGHILELTSCGGTATRIFMVAANPADSAMTAFLVIQVPDTDETAFQTVLSSFDVARAG